MAPAIDPRRLVDAELSPALDLILALMPPTAAVTPKVLEELRDRGASMSKPFLANPPVFSQVIPARVDAPEVTVYVINADPAVIRPAILHTHGGGFIAGSARASVADMQVIANALDCVVVTVEYRLAPETPFPGALEDNYAALRWMYESRDAIGVDPRRIALLGESAGGGHAAMLAMKARTTGEVPICLQALTYPMLDDRTGSTVQVAQHLGRYLWTSALNVAGWSALLGAPAGDDIAPEGAVPARCANLTGLPPTFIGVGALDLFVDEDIAFANHLIVAGVPTELAVIPGAYHGFDTIVPNAKVSQRYRLALLNALARAFKRPELTTPPDAAPLVFTLSEAAS